jgi:hypothetical protein
MQSEMRAQKLVFKSQPQQLGAVGDWAYVYLWRLCLLICTPIMIFCPTTEVFCKEHLLSCL